MKDNIENQEELELYESDDTDVLDDLNEPENTDEPYELDELDEPEDNSDHKASPNYLNDLEIITADSLPQTNITKTLITAFIAMIIGIIPPILCVTLSGSIFFPLYLAIPAAIGFALAKFVTAKGTAPIIITAAFTLIGIYLAITLSQVSVYATTFNIPLSDTPILALKSIFTADLLPKSAQHYVYPLLFGAAGTTAATFAF